MGIQIWASAKVWLVFTTKTIKVHLGVDIHIWGPEFAGIAHVDLSIVSFTISFGAASSYKLPGISWYQFIDEFFAKDTSNDKQPKICVGDVGAGLKKRVSDAQGAELNWIVSGDEVMFSTSTQIPSTAYSGANGADVTLYTPDDDVYAYNAPPLHVRPVNPGGAPQLQAKHSAWIEKIEEDGTPLLFTHLQYVPVLSNVPSATWSNYDDKQRKQGENNVIRQALTGFIIKPQHKKPDATLEVSNDVLKYEYVPTEDDPHLGYFDMTRVDQAPASGNVKDTINAPATQTKRSALVGAMESIFGWAESPTVDVSVFDDPTVVSLYDDPKCRVLGYEEVGA
jgi:hypothetical protein